MPTHQRAKYNRGLRPLLSTFLSSSSSFSVSTTTSPHCFGFFSLLGITVLPTFPIPRKCTMFPWPDIISWYNLQPLPFCLPKFQPIGLVTNTYFFSSHSYLNSLSFLQKNCKHISTSVHNHPSSVILMAYEPFLHECLLLHLTNFQLLKILVFSIFHYYKQL